MSPAAVLDVVVGVCLASLGVAFALAASRLVVGPSLPDRVVAVDLMAVLSVGFVAIVAIEVGQPVFIDVALVLALVTFLATVAFARYVERRGRDE